MDRPMGRRRRDGRPSSVNRGNIDREHRNGKYEVDGHKEENKLSPAMQIALAVATIGYIAATVYGCGLNPPRPN